MENSEIDPKLKAIATSIFGRMGGQSGTGAAKRRSPEHYAAASRKGVLARKKKNKNKA